MPHVVREDGINFVVPAYRDILSAKKAALLKKEILLLSGNYGNYITLNRKNADQYEATFASEPGYLLGESVWAFFKKPVDLIYCEAIPNTSEALLVIVKAGSVYLDGTFAIDSIQDELLIFKTQPGRFEIYIHGDVPISETPEPGKLALDASSVKSFSILAEPVFPTLPTPREYQLALVEAALQSKGIGVVPLKKVIIATLIPLVLFLTFIYFSTHKKQAPSFIAATINPWQAYYDTLNGSPAAADEIQSVIAAIQHLYTAPGWTPNKITYQGGVLSASMLSPGMNTGPLYAWSLLNNGQFQITSEGIQITLPVKTFSRVPTNRYYSMQELVILIIDKIKIIAYGMEIALGDIQQTGVYSTLPFKILFSNASLQSLGMIGLQLQNMPLILTKVEVSFDKTTSSFSGNLSFQALGK